MFRPILKGFLTFGLLAGFVSRSVAMGTLPVPPTPKNFKVSVDRNGIYATWNSTAYAVTLSVDGVPAVTTAGTDGAVILNRRLDLSVRHVFTLVCNSWVGDSPAAIVTIDPAAKKIDLQYQFVYAATKGPVFRGEIGFGSKVGEVTYVQGASVSPGTSSQAMTVQLDNSPIIYVTATETSANQGLSCGIAIPFDNASGSLAGHAVLVTLSDLYNDGTIICNISKN